MWARTVGSLTGAGTCLATSTLRPRALPLSTGLACVLAAAHFARRSQNVDSPSQCEAARRRKVAVYGGAFDPVTNAHVTCAVEIVHTGVADEVWMVPCGPRPDKPNLKTPAVDRYCMCQIAINSVLSPSCPVKVSDIDTFESEAAYTYDLLCALREHNPDCDFAFVIGSDWLQPTTNIAEWDSKNHNWKPGMPESKKTTVTGHLLLKEFDFLVIRRPGYEVPASSGDPTGLKRFGPRMSWVEMPHNLTFIEGNLSSTEIRKRRKKLSLDALEGLLPPGVLGFIARKNLYE